MNPGFPIVNWSIGSTHDEWCLRRLSEPCLPPMLRPGHDTFWLAYGLLAQHQYMQKTIVNQIILPLPKLNDSFINNDWIDYLRTFQWHENQQKMTKILHIKDDSCGYTGFSLVIWGGGGRISDCLGVVIWSFL